MTHSRSLDLRPISLQAEFRGLCAVRSWQHPANQTTHASQNGGDNEAEKQGIETRAEEVLHQPSLGQAGRADLCAPYSRGKIGMGGGHDERAYHCIGPRARLLIRQAEFCHERKMVGGEQREPVSFESALQQFEMMIVVDVIQM